MVRIVWTEFALEDLRLIHDYIAKDSKTYADRLIDKLIEGNHRIIYEIKPDYIGIIRIHHAARILQ